MTEKIEYLITYYSDVKLPNTTGLFTKTIKSGFKYQKEGESACIYIGLLYLFKKDGIDYEILQAESRFSIKDSTLTLNDLYEAYCHSIKALKEFPKAKQFQIDRDLKGLPIPPLGTVEGGLRLLLQKIQNGLP